MFDPHILPTPSDLAVALRDCRDRTLRLAAGIPPDRAFGTRRVTVNPPLWEFGHMGWFQERWLFRRDGAPPSRPDADALYDSANVDQATRWEGPMPGMDETLAGLRALGERTQQLLAAAAADDRELAYFATLSLFHEDMHQEALVMTRQALGDPAPELADAAPTSAPDRATDPDGDVEIPGGSYGVGASPELPFVFDNEKWEHAVTVRPFAIARRPVTETEFAAFVDDGGYAERRLWTAEGWTWRRITGARHPVYWTRDGRGSWWKRIFDRRAPLDSDRPVVHVNAFESEAWCRWAGRRLPTEAEWEIAARGSDGRRYPWGDAPPDPSRAHLDARVGDTAPVAGFAAGDTPEGCRQMIGNVWEWTADPFRPYPGFSPDPYEAYSRPWFGTHRVLRGGSWMARAHMIRNVCRNFYEPHRADVIAGFRTCAR